MIVAGFGAYGSIVGRFLMATGVETVVLDAGSDHVALMRQLGIRAYFGDASREELLRAEFRAASVASDESAWDATPLRAEFGDGRSDRPDAERP